MTITVSGAAPNYTVTGSYGNNIMPLARWEHELLMMCRDLRRSDKPLMIVIRWDGLAWAFHEAAAPRRVPEK